MSEAEVSGYQVKLKIQRTVAFRNTILYFLKDSNILILNPDPSNGLKRRTFPLAILFL